ncbi:MAG: UDP-N-acetylmuramate dehydrogenase [bacterium]|nr:UDP-N-acetylmuramate dehydrogenase [bacterium]
MSWLNGFDGRAERNAPLGALTWFGLGGRARHLVHPRGADALADVVRRAGDARGVPIKILGGGANLLVRDDGYDGIVVRLDDPSFQEVQHDGPCVRAGAGTDLMTFVAQCCRAGLAGLECLAGIPGTVGGAIRMNAGGVHGEISETVETVEVMTIDGVRCTLTNDEVGFSYRRTQLGGAVVTAVTFRLQPDNRDAVYDRFQEYWQVKKQSQPMADHSAGCIFTNPEGDSAGRLIDEAGLKGTSCGGARVSERHANFIVADRGACAGDVLRLIDRVRETVTHRFGTDLELEIDVW